MFVRGVIRVEQPKIIFLLYDNKLKGLFSNFNLLSKSLHTILRTFLFQSKKTLDDLNQKLNFGDGSTDFYEIHWILDPLQVKYFIYSRVPSDHSAHSLPLRVWLKGLWEPPLGFILKMEKSQAQKLSLLLISDPRGTVAPESYSCH